MNPKGKIGNSTELDAIANRAVKLRFRIKRPVLTVLDGDCHKLFVGEPGFMPVGSSH